MAGVRLAVETPSQSMKLAVTGSGTSSSVLKTEATIRQGPEANNAIARMYIHFQCVRESSSIQITFPVTQKHSANESAASLRCRDTISRHLSFMISIKSKYAQNVSMRIQGNVNSS